MLNCYMFYYKPNPSICTTKVNYILCLASFGDGNGKLPRGHAQFDFFDFPRENFPVRLLWKPRRDNLKTLLKTLIIFEI